MDIIHSKPHFYFLLKPYLGPSMAHQADYAHLSVWFAEGLQALNIPFSSNIDYYPDPSGNFLFRQSLSTSYQFIVTQMPENFSNELLHAKKLHKKIIILDDKDQWCRHTSTQFIPIAYKYLMTTSIRPTPPIIPICFSITNRLIQAFNNITPFSQRSRSIAFTHRVSNHSVRNFVKDFYSTHNTPVSVFHDQFATPSDPVELHWWAVTGRRHSNQYFSFIQSHMLVDAHGGYFANDRSILQWDSWKFWEAILAGSAVITADLKYYNIALPFDFIPFVHYLPVRYDNILESYQRILSLSDKQLATIANNARNFVLSKYSPQSIVAHILSKF
jgi:hypothetical protein